MNTPPAPARRPRSHTLHGHTRTDPYDWLRAENWQEVMRDPATLDPEIRAYLEAENAHTEACLAPVAELRKALFEEMKARLKEDDSSVPAADGKYRYFVRHVAGGQQPVFVRVSGGGAEEILLDANAESRGRSFYRIGACRHSPDHRRLAYSADISGSEYFTIRFRDLDTGRDLPDEIGSAQAGFVWANDSATVFYIVLDGNHRPRKVMRHRIGDDPATDELVYDQPDTGFYMGIDKTEDGRFILIDVHDHRTSEVHVVDADAPASPARMVAARRTGVEYDVTHRDGTFLILTNDGGAEDFKIVEAPVDASGPENWTDLIPHRPGRLIRAMLLFEDHLVRLERAGGLPHIVIRRLADGVEHEISFAEDAYDLGVVPGYEYDTATLRFTYSSLTTPQQTFDYDMATRARTLRKQQEVPSGHDPDAYVTHRIWAVSPDGAKVPVSILHKKSTAIDGTAPLLLYGYGSYGINIAPSFRSTVFSLVDRGFVYAIAHIRGGMDLGYGWYTGGKLMQKKNTFLDFIAAAETLIETGYTATGNIAAQGGSAGGMLVGAVANMRPDLFKAIVAEVPFVDVINTITDETLPLTPPEWPEWGDPITNRDAYRYMLSYSPYDNVTAQDYPHILATAGLTDPRVTYWESAKWVAKLRALKTDDNLLLLRTNMTAGHQGAAGRFDKLDEVALVFAFLLMVFGRGGG